MSKEPHVRFVPSGVDGLPSVTEVIVRADRLELLSNNSWVVFRFTDIARWPRPRWLWRILDCLGLRRRDLLVADRDFFHYPAGRFFAFYTQPPVVVHMPADEPAERRLSTFLKFQLVMGEGGFSTFDLG